ncbi:MAG TPA: T9SS type A sorting domain-containing protein [Vicingaceae bacterium]
MLKGLNILFVSLLIINNIGYSQNFEWAASSLCIPSGPPMTNFALDLDQNGNSYIIGNFSDSVDFDPGSGVTMLYPVGGRDAFVQKLDVNGNFVWVKQIGGNLHEAALSIIIDKNGDIVVGGLFSDTVDFDPGPGVYNQVAQGSVESYLLKLDTNGNFIWAIQTASSVYAQMWDAEIDSANNIVMTGFFKGSVDFDPGLTQFNIVSAGLDDVYIWKLSPNGNLIWAKSFGGTSEDRPRSMDIGPDQEIVIAGGFIGPTDFDPSTGVYTVPSSGSATAGYILKLDYLGNFVWVKTSQPLASNSYAYVYDISIDSMGNIYSTGKYEGSVDFGSVIYVENTSGPDLFYQKMDKNGILNWINRITGSGSDNNMLIKCDNKSVYLCSVFNGTRDLHPKNAVKIITSNGNYDYVISRLDLNGNFLWTRTIGGTGYDGIYGIHIDENENFYATGSHHHVVDFNPNSGVDTLGVYGHVSGYTFKWSQDSCSGVSLEVDSLRDISCIDSGFVLLKPLFPNGNYNFNWSPSPTYVYDSVATFSQDGLYNVSITDSLGCQNSLDVQIEMTQYLSGTDNLSICEGDSILIKGQYYSNSITVKDTINSTQPCDSIVTINLTILDSVTYKNITTCDSLSIPNGNVYTVSGVYTDTLLNHLGCDSISTVNLNIKGYTSSVILNEIACDSFVSYSGNYTWYNTGTYFDTTTSSTGCDIYMTVNLTIDNFIFNNPPINICQGDSVLIYGTYQNTSGVYYDSLQTINGCDSVLSTTLTVNLLPNVTLSNFNPDTICSSSSAVTLPNGSPSGGVYSGTGVSGGTFDPNTAGLGTHSVIYTYTDINSCINSDSTFITVEQCVGIDDLANDLGILIYPNPNTGLFTIEKSSELDKEIRVNLLDASSRVIIDKLIPKGQQKIEMDITSYSKGIYYLQLTVGKEVFVKKILKN